MQNCRELKVWQKAHPFVLAIYRVTRNFPDTERYGIISQLRRAASSVPTNLAEGCGRGSTAELAQFVQIASGSASETDYLLILSRDLEYLDGQEYTSLNNNLVEIRKMLSALIKKLRGNLSPRPADHQQPKTSA